MPAKTFTQLTNIDEQNIDNANDVFAVWDNAHATDSPQAKQLKAKNVLTSPDTSVSLQTSPAVSTTGNISRVVCVNQDGYDSLSPKDSNTLYVITDGVTLDSYNGQIDTPTASKTYYLDADVVSARTVSNIQMFYTSGVGGAGTVTLNVGADSTNVYTFAASQTSQPLGGPLSPKLAAAAGDQISLTMSAGVTDVTDFLFVVEYEV